MKAYRSIVLAVLTLATGGTVALAPTAANAAIAAGTGDVFAVDIRGGSGRTEAHAFAAADQYHSYSVHAATALGPTSLTRWAFGFGDYDRDGIPDLYAVDTLDSAGTHTAAHVFSGASNYQTALLHRQLPQMGSASLTAWQFAVGDYNGDGRGDLIAVNTRDSGGTKTAAHVFDAATGLNSYLLHRVLPGMGSSSLTTWQFGAGDYNADGRADLFAVNSRDSSGTKTAAHVFNGANGFTTYLLHRVLPGMGGSDLTVWEFTPTDYDRDGRADLAAINTNDQNRVAVHVLSGASGLSAYSAHSITPMTGARLTEWQFVGWTGAGGGTVPPNPYPAEEVESGWTRRMQYVVDHLNIAFDPRGCGGQAGGGGHIPGSDHYTGNAADCFASPAGTIAVGADKALGDGMANWAAVNGPNLQVKYVIWYAQIFDFRDSTPHWREYCHQDLTPAQCANPQPGREATLQHMDHVHISVWH